MAKPSTDILSANAQIAFRDEAIPSELRNVANRSVATLIARSIERVAQARAAEAELAKLTDAIEAPMAKLIQEDPQAASALKELQARGIIEAGIFSPEGQDAMHSAPELIVRPLARDYGGSATIFSPPFDFAWSWHDETGHPPFNQTLDRPTGSLGLDARSGLGPGGASGFVNAHAGFALFLTTDRTVNAGCWALLDPVTSSYVMRCVGIGSNATSEGGVEVTALENGNLIASASLKLWRRRISAGESASARDRYTVTIPNGELTFTMVPGRNYAFNVGIWVFTDRSTGVGGAAAQSLLQATVKQMWVRR